MNRLKIKCRRRERYVKLDDVCMHMSSWLFVKKLWWEVHVVCVAYGCVSVPPIQFTVSGFFFFSLWNKTSLLMLLNCCIIAPVYFSVRNSETSYNPTLFLLYFRFLKCLINFTNKCHNNRSSSRIMLINIIVKHKQQSVSRRWCRILTSGECWIIVKCE